jgi:predicted metal-dependent phosphoesterase TrpH
VIDLHTHSTISDGTDTPRELINKAHANALEVIALTDHDSIAGWEEATQTLRAGMQLVLGSEISCQTEDGISVHMLALLFDPSHAPLQDVLAQTRDNRYTRMTRIITRLNDNGFEITLEEVLEQLSKGATLGRPHLADALVAKGYAKNRDEIFEKWLHNNSPYYVAHYSPTPEDAIRLIKSAGGVAVIAHPMASLRGRTVSVDSFASFVEAGLDGIEIYHRDHSADQRILLENIAADLDVLRTGSSDYHGDGKLNELAENTTSPDQWEALESRADARRVIRKG